MAYQRSASSGFETTAMTRSRSRGESDLEKDGYRRSGHATEDDTDDEDDVPCSYSSRATSASHQPMVNKAFSSRSKRPMFRCTAYGMRWLCLGIAGTILIFMYSLVHLSWASAKQIEVEVANDKLAPKPPKWESFPFLKRYYGGVRSLIPRSANEPEYPRDVDEVALTPANVTITERAIMESVKLEPYHDNTRVECFLDKEGKIRIPAVRYYQGIPKGFPDAVMGSNTLLGIRNDICYDRFGRLGPYGLGYSLNRGGSGAQQEGEREGADMVWQATPEVDYRGMKWAEIQDRCATANKGRFVKLPSPRIDRFRAMQIGSPTKRDEPPAEFAEEPESHKGSSEKLPRTAVIIRTWRDYSYTPEDLIYLRSLISELSLLSGGEYLVHFLIQVKDDNAPIWSDDETYEKYLFDALPEEFRGMGTLWSERQMGLMYGGLEETFMRDLPVHGVYRSTFMPMQFFAFQHPEFDYFWNWEMDVRYTGHWYHLFDSVKQWAKRQPRKFLWERNSRFYVPSEHGSWEEFSHMVRLEVEKGTNSVNNMWSGLQAAGAKVPGVDKQMEGDRPIWGPERPVDDDVAFDTDPVPPTSHDKDKYSWGVGEEADLITFNPLFDPDGTTWLLAEDTSGYNKTRDQPPRRTAIITASRLSRKLLMTMHRETSLKRHTMFSEMWPASCALHHGLKAVYAPHSEYIDRQWPTKYLETVFNAGRNGATGGARTSVFGDREHNFRGTTWYYNAGFPEVLWHRWLGYRFNGDGGEVEEVAGEGRMCLPAMLLHPIKRVNLVIEGLRGG